MVAAVGEAIILWVGGRLGVKYGPSRVMAAGAILTAVIAFPVFFMLISKNPVLVVLAITLGVTVASICYAAQGAILTALFPPNLRLSGVTSATNIGAIFSGFMPLIAAALVASAGGSWWPAPVLLIVLSLLTLVSALLAPRLSVGDPSIKY
ncbi:MAG: MFS transporter [Acidipropionibacterium sp.]|jgi:MFS family permease|nr:MFS transporter [Acidipropionibacterium sp.]